LSSCGSKKKQGLRLFAKKKSSATKNTLFLHLPSKLSLILDGKCADDAAQQLQVAIKSKHVWYTP